jgi:predicted ATP-grasp superfamily ATP-dependent carboligase
MAGSILNECLTMKITGLAFLTPAIVFAQDPEGAVALVEAINKVYDLKVDTKDLLDKAEEIKKEIEGIGPTAIER